MAKAHHDLLSRLQEKSREQLLALLEQLVQRQPEIEPLVELLIELPQVAATPQKKRPGRGRERTLDPSALQSQVASAFYRAGTGWGAASRIAAELEHLCDIGKDFAEAGQWANAQAVYATLAEETILQYEEVHDEGQISWVLGQCAAGLLKCLHAQSSLPREEQLDAASREALLLSLFGLWKFGNEYGGIGEDVAGAMAQQGTERERTRVETWLREEMRPVQDPSSAWHNRRVIDFLATLKQAEHGSEEEVLEEYRSAGLSKELAEKYLQFGRQTEALGVARANVTEPRDVTWFAEQLRTSGGDWEDQALAFVEMRLGEVTPALQGNPRDFASAQAADTYRRWLGDTYLLSGKARQALEMETARFQANPDQGTYRSVRSAAQAPGQPEDLWPGLRPQLIGTLEQQARWGALVSILLDEGEVGQALAALAEMERAPRPPLYGYSSRAPDPLSQYQAHVAKAAEESYPDEAIRLYRCVAQALIDGRGRENYQQAATYVSRIRQLSQKQGREAEWHTFLANLRNSNKSLRALQEELDKAGL